MSSPSILGDAYEVNFEIQRPLTQFTKSQLLAKRDMRHATIWRLSPYKLHLVLTTFYIVVAPDLRWIPTAIVSSAFGLSSSSSSKIKVNDACTGEGGDDSLAKQLVKEQLGYLPSNFLRITAWTSKSRNPIAIQTYPLQGGAKRRQAKAMHEHGKSANLQSPFPTLYWLICPNISRCVADLERRGYLQEFETRLNADKVLVDRLWMCHRQYADERWQALSQVDRRLLSEATEPALVRMRGIMQNSGISGSNLTKAEDSEGESSLVGVPAIKCLHAHYAQFCSTRDNAGIERNPIGEMIHQQLTTEFPDLEL